MFRLILIAGGSFVLMEFFAYLVHRFVYHGALWFIHKSHHAPRSGAFEWNDLFPLAFSAASIALMVYALSGTVGPDVLAATIGIISYGTTYFVIHDLYAHRRMKSLTFGLPYLRRLKKAHMVHHSLGGEPYGLLVFKLPKGVSLDPLPEEREG